MFYVYVRVCLRPQILYEDKWEGGVAWLVRVCEHSNWVWVCEHTHWFSMKTNGFCVCVCECVCTPTSFHEDKCVLFEVK